MPANQASWLPEATSAQVPGTLVEANGTLPGREVAEAHSDHAGGLRRLPVRAVDADAMLVVLLTDGGIAAVDVLSVVEPVFARIPSKPWSSAPAV